MFSVCDSVVCGILSICLCQILQVLRVEVLVSTIQVLVLAAFALVSAKVYTAKISTCATTYSAIMELVS